LNIYAKNKNAKALLKESAEYDIPSYNDIGRSAIKNNCHLKTGVIFMAIAINNIQTRRLANLPISCISGKSFKLIPEAVYIKGE